MKVQELIEKLKEFPLDAPVMFATSPKSCIQVLRIYDDEKGWVWFDIELSGEEGA